jgi:glycosyltransferase involved in cell wall biosynthesis
MGCHVEGLRIPPDVSLVGVLWKLLRFFRRDPASIVHVQYLAPGLVPIVAARLAGKRVVTTVHQPARGRRHRLLVRLAARLTSAVVCVSQATQKSWFGKATAFEVGQKDLTARHYTIWNAVDADAVWRNACAAREEGLAAQRGWQGRSAIGCVGRLRAEKGQEDLVTALPAIVARNPATLLLMIGDGPQRQELQELARKLHVDANIAWIGALSPEEVYRMLGVMQALVVPSRYEAFGLCAAEGMAAGLPVVASAVDGLREVVMDGETGLLVPRQTPDALADAVNRLLDAPALRERMGQAGRRRVSELFPVNRFNESYQALFRLVRR